MHTYHGMALDLARQNAVLVQVVQSNCKQISRSGGAREFNAEDLLRGDTTSASVCDAKNDL